MRGAEFDKVVEMFVGVSFYTKEIAKDGLLRGGGNTSSAKMFKSSNGEETVRPADFKIVFDAPSGEHLVYPDVTKGLSFSSTLRP